jgi:hypothetical protein
MRMGPFTSQTVPNSELLRAPEGGTRVSRVMALTMIRAGSDMIEKAMFLARCTRG